ncbi:DUF4870 domain-containing protein [Bacillaceae bacterium CLA-AA-H227]|uniref:DUF4870 domain-containing protein n=1 Tax=Robertmurraya yapensis (ex Hitch et al 2024) TaxID=3133160 RepID=A0ACC6SG09_9BACI
MDSNKILAALSYFSIFFAGIIVPIVVLCVSGDKEVKHHAKKALISHLLLLIPVPIIIFAAFADIIGIHQGEVPIMLFVGFIISIILSIVIFIWNIVKGIQVLSKETII